MDFREKYLPELVNGLVGIYSSSLQRVYLYGSVARGTATEESDIDVAVILSAETEEQHEKLLDLVTDLDLKYDAVFSVITIEASRFYTRENTLPFYRNIKTEGVELWTAA